MVLTLERPPQSLHCLGLPEALALVIDAAAVADRLLARALLPLDLSPSQLRALLALTTAERPLTPGDIATLLGQETQSASGLLIRLERRGLVRRHHDPSDRRRVLVTLTSGGATLAEAAADVLVDVSCRLSAALAGSDCKLLELAALRDLDSETVEPDATYAVARSRLQARARK